MIIKLLILVFSFQSIVNSEVQVKTSCGPVKGQTIHVFNQTINQFLGIPFAEPPVGDLRFARPKPLTECSKVIDATIPKNACVQPPIAGHTTGEDCLYLNIWSQSSETSKLRPVMFWIHGGRLKSGTAFLKIYNGSVLAANDVVFVSTNYRLDKLGFLYGGNDSAPGNMGFYDQLMALDWVRDNIHHFGGDKDQITIFGQSAGSWSVTAHILSPLSRGKFKRAILESGAIMHNKDRPVFTKEEAVAYAITMAKHFGCNEDEWLQCLKKVDANDIIDYDKVAQRSYPVFGTQFLPYTTQEAFSTDHYNKDLDIIAGLVPDEGPSLAYYSDPKFFQKHLTEEDFITYAKRQNNIYHNLDINKVKEFYLKDTNLSDSDAIKWKIYDFYGDIVHKCPTYLFAKRYAEHSINKKNIYFYEFDYRTKDLSLTGSSAPVSLLESFGIFHGSELPFVFGLPLLENEYKYQDEIELSKRMVKMWTNFAKEGRPDSEWKSFLDSSGSSQLMIRSLKPSSDDNYKKGLFKETCDGFWKEYF